MKISKLFHWLYALLMLLPAFFVGGRMLYVTFNKNAKDSYSNTNIVEDSTIISDTGNVINGRLYELQVDLNKGTVNNPSVYYPYSDISVDWVQYGAPDGRNYVSFCFYKTSTNYYVYVRDDENRTYTFWYGIGTFGADFNFAFVSSDNVIQNGYQPLILSTYNYRKSTLDNAFDYSMNQLNELPLFAWAKDSFLVEPFAYIGDLFGLPNDSPILTLLSYWLDISLIWLVFDLLMYVPLLAHRWLDKGVLE